MNKTLKAIVIATIFIVSIVSTATVVSYYKENEVNKASASKDDIYELLQSKTDKMNDWLIYDKMMIKGLQKLSSGTANEGYAESDYDDAGLNYEAGYYDVAESYADSADVMYAYASDGYRGGKAYFSQAMNYAPDNKTYQLAELYVALSDMGAELMDEMHQANEYFSSACFNYYNEWWEIGDNEIEWMNEHIVLHDNLVPAFNDCSSDIDALLELF